MMTRKDVIRLMKLGSELRRKKKDRKSTRRS